MAPARLLGPDGRPVEASTLKAELARARMGSVRSPVIGYPADGLTPSRLGAILREADAGDPLRYMELAYFAEARDPHYAGVIGTRRRSVAQLPVEVEAASDAPVHEALAAEVRAWLKRGTLRRAMFDILDCIPKGYSFTEIVWDNPGGTWVPVALKRRDPRWFRFNRIDLETPMMLSDTGQEEALPPAKFIFARISAISGLPLQSGIARVALWSYLFKKFTERDWQIFIQTYGQPLRLGKYGAGATEADKETLFQAVANIAGDCAAIVPESMEIEFVETGQLAATGDLYEKRCAQIDQQLSKLVLGQTATTDAVTGGLGSGKEHRQVQEDIETSDATEIAAVLTEQLIEPWMRLNGVTDGFPRLKIGRPEEEDLKALGAALGPMVDRGLKVPQAWVRGKFGVPEAEGDEELLSPAPGGGEASAQPSDAGAVPGRDGTPPLNGQRGKIKGGKGNFRPSTALQASGPADPLPRAPAPEEALADRMAVEAAPAMEALLLRIEAMVQAAGSLPELREMLLAGFPEIDAADLAEALAQGLLGAHLAGRVEVLDRAGDDGRDGAGG